MSDFEFIDLFKDEKKSLNNAKQETETLQAPVYGENDMMFETSAQRMTLNDYKNAGHSVKKSSSPVSESVSHKRATTGKSLKLDDEKIVWAGAIFVFFGVFVFLIGYWLGKSTMRSVRSNNEQYLAKIEKTLEQKQLENTPAVPDQEGAVDSAVPETEASPQPDVKIPESAKEDAPIVAPPINDPVIEKKPVHKNVEKKTLKKTVHNEKKPLKQIADQKGDYTLQVSAHTRMEKARFVESRLRAKGLQAYIVESMVNGKRYFRVRVGKFDSKNQAKKALAKIKKTTLGKDSYMIKL